MSVTAADVERLVHAHDQITEALGKNRPRDAANIVCAEFRRLLEDPALWDGTYEAYTSLKTPPVQDQELMLNIRHLVDREADIVAKLGFDEAKTAPILARVYGGLDIVSALREHKMDEAFKNLNERLQVAADLVCRESKGPIRRSVDWLVSWRGAGVIAGAATATANAVVAIHDGGAVSWVSIKAGIKLMAGDVEGIIDLFKG